jgi:hypothetical protein
MGDEETPNDIGIQSHSEVMLIGGGGDGDQSNLSLLNRFKNLFRRNTI